MGFEFLVLSANSSQMRGLLTRDSKKVSCWYCGEIEVSEPDWKFLIPSHDKNFNILQYYSKCELNVCDLQVIDNVE